MTKLKPCPWPKANAREKRNGWTLSPVFLGRVQDEMRALPDYDEANDYYWETIQGVLIAASKVLKAWNRRLSEVEDADNNA